MYLKCASYGEGQSQLKIKTYIILECVHGAYKDITGLFLKRE